MNQEKQPSISRRQYASMFVMFLSGLLGPYMFQFHISEERVWLQLMAPLWYMEISTLYGIRTSFGLSDSFLVFTGILWVLGNMWLIHFVFLYFVYCSLKGTIKRRTAIASGFMCHSFEILFFIISMSSLLTGRFQGALIGPFPLLLLIGILIILIEGRDPENNLQVKDSG